MERTAKIPYPSLASLKKGQQGRVVAIQGGRGMACRLESLGIRPGCRFTKVSNSLFRGPVTVQVGNSRVAIGFGMASRILVEVNGES